MHSSTPGQQRSVQLVFHPSTRTVQTDKQENNLTFQESSLAKEGTHREAPQKKGSIQEGDAGTDDGGN